MIGYIKGKVVKKLDRSIIVAPDGLGYEVFVKSSSWAIINENDTLELFIHTQMREAEISLYGFENAEELSFFRQIINVNGIGPKTGLEFLSMPIEKLKGAILQKDIAFICQTPGIGKKIAERLVMELKDKISVENADFNLDRKQQGINDEVIFALENLGYAKHHVKKILASLPEEITKTEDIIKYFLQNT